MKLFARKDIEMPDCGYNLAKVLEKLSDITSVG